MSIFQEFKTFALRGNAVDLAVGVVIGAAFGRIVTSLVNDLIMPPVGYLLGGVNFNNLAITLKPATTTEPAVMIKYGTFISTCIDFFIVAVCIFLVVKGMNAIMRGFGSEEAPIVKKCPECSMEIPVQAKRCGHCTTKL